MKASEYDALIIGGSHAGLSAAMALGRLRRSALVVDAGEPRNRSAAHANNISGLDGMSPEEIRERAQRDLEKYPTISFLRGRVDRVNPINNKFTAILDSGQTVVARKVILAFGIRDTLPEVPSLREQWGKNVFHCPYCHGFEIQNQNIGLIGNGPFVEHVVPMLFNLTKKLTIFTLGKANLSEDFVSILKHKGVIVVETLIQNLEFDNKKLKSVTLEGGQNLPIDAIFLSPIPPLVPSSSIATDLGCEKNDMGFVQVKEMGKTSVPGVFAAGDIMSIQQSVVGAMATGQMAGSGAVFELSNEDFSSSAE